MIRTPTEIGRQRFTVAAPKAIGGYGEYVGGFANSPCCPSPRNHHSAAFSDTSEKATRSPQRSAAAEPRAQVDVHVENRGSIFLVRPVSNSACDWLTENVQNDAQYFGSALVCEHRYISDLVEGMREAGLVVD